jgi:hypothetical protein
VPFVASLLAQLAYRAAIVTANSYGEALARAVDLYRFDVLKRLRYPLPANAAAERILYAHIERLLLDEPSSGNPLVPYRHRDEGADQLVTVRIKP